jgi:hypothetical protein
MFTASFDQNWWARHSAKGKPLVMFTADELQDSLRKPSCRRIEMKGLVQIELIYNAIKLTRLD